MYYPDGSKYVYTRQSEINNIINIGWLSHEFAFNKGEVDAYIKNKVLEIIYSKKCNTMRGIHKCDFCKSEVFVPHYNGKILLGNAEVWIPSINHNLIYASPTLIYHYIDAHHYLPTANYLESLMSFDLNSN